jgi:hypothetical protein
MSSLRGASCSWAQLGVRAKWGTGLGWFFAAPQARDPPSLTTLCEIIAFNLAVTFPAIFFLFKETKGLSLEEIDLLFGDRALGALPKDLREKEDAVNNETAAKRA